MNSDEMTGILLELPKESLKLERQFSYFKEKECNKNKLSIKIEELENLVKYWKNETTKVKVKYEKLVKDSL